ncbi:MAG TPA: sialate O-acetylesterase [Tepidisphaeraceae bacterium]|nr:sialate O-acetylesterase [Tepidisphaeraceae bacterium]
MIATPRMNLLRLLILSLLLWPASVEAADKPYLSPAFGNHMMLQRDRPNTFWGWTKPGSDVTVSIGSQQTKCTAGADGKWIARIIPPKVGGPYSVVIDGPAHLELTDVMVGDVWICSGQSNMEFGISNEKDAAKEIAQSNDPSLRLYFAPRQVALSPSETNNGQWLVCSPENVIKNGWGGFSAVGYHFGHALRRELGVPIGLIEDNWGGTPAETWTSEQSLTPLGDFAPGLKIVDSLRQDGSPPYGNYLDVWLAKNDLGSKPDAGWQSLGLDESDWTPVKLPNGFNDVGMSTQAGVVWFRKSFDLPDPLPGGNATLSLGPIYQIDQTWVNGEPVGSSGSGPAPRRYALPSKLLKAGKNLLAVRVIGRSQKRGFQGPAEMMFVQLSNGTRIPVVDGWKAKVSAKFTAENPGPVSYDQYPNLPSVLFNGMIEPQIPMAIRGAIWYQGESNAGRAWQYRALLPAMISDWRHSFDQGDFPFYIVSLAAYQPHKDVPGDDEWAELREAQAMTARDVPNSGLALAIDVGDAKDVHPKDKKTVGERLALVALANEYAKKEIVYSGPIFREMKREASSIRLSFDHTDGGLKSTGEKLGEFAIAGADHQWHWANAKIEQNTVVVNSPDVPDPQAVRYAWQANPVATLTNGAGLPAVPFRTDDWPEITAGRK